MAKFKLVKKLKSNKGITLIELILSISISLMIVSLIVTLFIHITNLYRDINDNIEIQQQGHFIMDFMSSKIHKSNKIIYIKDYNNIERYNTTDELKLKEIWFEDHTLEGKKGHLFSIQKDPKVEGNSIRYSNNLPITIEAANYIESIYTKPLPKGKSYSEAKGIELAIKMKKGNAKIELIKRIYFRNFDKYNKV